MFEIYISMFCEPFIQKCTILVVNPSNSREMETLLSIRHVPQPLNTFPLKEQTENAGMLAAK